jgi:predicted MFS family arabinose efflux permease
VASESGDERAIFTRDFAFATVANLFVSLGQQMVLATLPVYVITLGGTRTDAGLVTGSAAITALLVDRVHGEQRGLALSTYFMGFDVGIGLGAVGLGAVSQTLGWEVMWPTSALCVLLGLLGLVGRAK